MIDPAALDQLVDGIRRHTREKLAPIDEEVAERDEIPGQSGGWSADVHPDDARIPADAVPGGRRSAASRWR